MLKSGILEDFTCGTNESKTTSDISAKFRPANNHCQSHHLPTCFGSSNTPWQIGHIKSESTSPTNRTTSYPISEKIAHQTKK